MKAYRKILSLLLAFVMILGVLPMGSLKASAAGKVWKQVNTTDTWQPENGHKYILVQGNASKALTSNSGTIGTADVTINGNVLTANSYSNITFTFDSNYMTAQNGSIKYMLSPIYGWAWNISDAVTYTTKGGYTVISSSSWAVNQDGSGGGTAGTPSASNGFRIFEEVADGGTDPTNPGETDPIETEPPQRGPSNLPKQHMVVGFWHNFDNGLASKPMKLSDVPETYDMICVAFADSTGNGGITYNFDGCFESLGYTADQFKKDIQDIQAQGRRVILSIGGQNGSLAIRSQEQANNFRDSVIRVIDEWGFNGLDIDLEDGTSLGSLPYLVEPLHEIDAHYDGNFILTAAPESYYFSFAPTAGDVLSNYQYFVNDCADILDMVFPQYYNNGGSTAEIVARGVENLLTYCPNLRDDQVGIGLPAAPGAAGSGYMSNSEIETAVRALATGGTAGGYQVSRAHEALRGMMCWSCNWDMSTGFAWSNAMAPLMASLPTVDEPDPTDPIETDPPETDPPETDPPETDPPETDPPVATHNISFWATVKGSENDEPLEGVTGLTGAGTYNDGEMVTVTAPLTQTIDGKSYELVSIGFRDESLDHDSFFYTWMYEGEDEGGNGTAMRPADRDWSFLATYQEVTTEEPADQYIYISLLDESSFEGTDLLQFQDRFETFEKLYAPGTKVTVTAPEILETATTRYTFSYWADPFGDKLQDGRTLEITVSADEMENLYDAVYTGEAITYYSVTVSTAMQANDGTAAPGGATISATSVKGGDSVTATAKAAAGYDFVGWFAAAAQGTAYTGTPLSTSLSYTFKPTADTKLAAVYKVQTPAEPENVNITVVGRDFTITVDGKTSALQRTKATRKLPIGTEVTVNCTDSGFVSWQSEYGMILSKQSSYTFTVLAPATYTAATMDTVSNTGLVEFISDYNQVMACFTYLADDEVEFPAGPVKIGFVFDGWDKTEAEIQNLIASGEKHIVVSPKYHRDMSIVYDLTVYVDGVQSSELSKTGVAYARSFELEAPAAAGKQFKCWATDAAGKNVLGYASTCFVKMLDNMTVYAIYVNEGETIDRAPTISITPMTAVDGQQKITTTIIRNVPEGYTMVEHGVLVNRDGSIQNPTSDSFVIGGANIVKAQVTNDAVVGADTPTVTISNDHLNTTVFLRGYLVVQNQAGEREYFYTDIISGVYNVLANG